MARSEAENLTAWMCSTIGISSISAIFWEETVRPLKIVSKTTYLTNEAVKETLGDFLPSAVPVSSANFAERVEGLRGCKYYQHQQREECFTRTNRSCPESWL